VRALAERQTSFDFHHSMSFSSFTRAVLLRMRELNTLSIDGAYAMISDPVRRGKCRATMGS
jgi:hypothetical protein